MLLGEFDFMDMIVRDPDNFWLTKLLFALFLVLMSVVLMNLVIGLAISDIGSLRLTLKRCPITNKPVLSYKGTTTLLLGNFECFLQRTEIF